jgi:hypothetical protein
VARAFGSVAVGALFLCSAAGGVVEAHEIAVDKGAAEVWCGQYECVVSSPLSEREIAVSLATLAAVRPLPDPSSLSQAPPSSVRRGSIAVSARD